MLLFLLKGGVAGPFVKALDVGPQTDNLQEVFTFPFANPSEQDLDLFQVTTVQNLAPAQFEQGLSQGSVGVIQHPLEERLLLKLFLDGNRLVIQNEEFRQDVLQFVFLNSDL